MTPSLDLDFTASDILDSRITASGGANGSRIDAAGLVVPGTAPRFDYGPISLVSRGILIEEARTNLHARSDALDNAAWSLAGASIAANAVTGPDGTASADKLVESAANSPHAVYDFGMSLAAGDRVAGADAKPAGRDWLRAVINAGSAIGAWFNVSTGAVGTVDAGVTASIKPAPNGFYRCSVMRNVSAPVTGGPAFYACSANEIGRASCRERVSSPV